MKQYADFGLKLPVVGGETAGDDALLRSLGDEAIGMYSCCPYTLDLDTGTNKRFIAAMQKDWNDSHPNDPMTDEWLDEHLHIVEHAPHLMTAMERPPFSAAVKSP